jgi:hypothetical protein
MQTVAVVLEKPEDLVLRTVALVEPAAGRRCRRRAVDRNQFRHRTPAVVGPHAAVSRHGLSAGPGLRNGRRVSKAGSEMASEGDRVFVPGANCYSNVRGLFGGAAARLVVPAARVVPIEHRMRARTASSSPSPPPPITPSPAKVQRFPNSSSATAFWAGCWPASPSPWVRRPHRVGDERTPPLRH